MYHRPPHFRRKWGGLALYTSMSKHLVVWLTGLPCSGKTTLAEIVRDKLDCEMLDGDDLRGSDFSKGIGFTPEDRERHLLRVGYLAKRLSRYNDVICSFVSPSEPVRQKLPVDLTVYVKCPLDVCMDRDVKGMYAKAKAGEITNFTGYNAPYEEPKNPDLTLDTAVLSKDECVDRILSLICALK